MEKTKMVRDWRGRDYLVDESPRALIDRSRSLMFWLPWAAMAAIGPLQYGYAAAVPALMESRGWTVAAALAPLAVWIACQAAAALPTAVLLRRGRTGVRAALGIGGALSGSALLTVALAHDTMVVIAGYAVLGGTGAGLVYGACTEAVARWHPERPAARVGFTTGAFAYGTGPLVVAVGLDADMLAPSFVVAALVAWAVAGTAAVFVNLPPRHWWPGHIDPRAWACDRLALRRNPRALREFSVGQALRTGAFPALVPILVCAGAVSVFDVVALATADTTAPWIAVALLLVFNGAGRACAMLISESTGRERALGAVLTLLCLGQLILAAGTAAGSAIIVLAGAVPAGLGGGAFYPLVAGLAREYFGEEQLASVHGAVYSAKALAGLLGAGLAGLAMTSSGHATALLVALALAGTALAMTATLRRPGWPATLPR
jgi:MFS family permease